MRFELFIATRYLRAKRRQAFIGIITGISILGVAAGVASLIVALAVNNGFRQDLQARLLGSTAHISLLRVESDGMRDWRPLLEKLSKQPHVVAAAPAIYEQVLISRGPRARGAVLKGMLPQYERKVSDLLKTVAAGSAAALEEQPAVGKGESSVGAGSKSDASATVADKSVRPTHAESPDDLTGVQQRVAAMPPIILGQDMAEGIGATVGSVVLVTSPQGELTPFGMVPKYIRFRVAGIFNSGFYDYDSQWAFIRLADAQELFGLGDVISVIQFKIDDIYRAGEVARSLEEAADLFSGSHGFMTTSWMEQNKPLFRALRLERVVTFITIGLIVFVAALNIL
ncbi:MAG: ABC transporter permease, partial [Candidatus Sulfotelmatobacter sp.]